MAIRVGVVGVAGVGRAHLERARGNERAELVGLADVDPAVRERIAGEFEVPGYASLAELLERAKPQAVVLATPPRSHRPLTEEAAAAGVHVLCEKPMAPGLADCRAMIDACRRAGVTLMLGHKKRFAPALGRLRELIDGELGAPGFFVYRYPHPGRSERDWFWDEADGGGPLLENVVHAAYTLRWLLGDVEQVTAAASSFLFPDRTPQINCAAITLRMRSGAVGALGAGMVSVRGFHFEDLYLAAEGGVAQLSGHFDAPEQLAWALRRDGDNVREETFADVDLFAAELDHFLGCVATGAPPETGGDEGLRAIELCLAWKRAAREDRPVRIEECAGVK